MNRSHADAHYLSDEVDPLFIAGSRDYLYPHLRRDRILNLGLGYGTWDERLALETDCGVYGLDFSQHLIDTFTVRYPSIRYVCADVFDYEPDAPFDTIVASHFLEHMADPVLLLRRLSGWLAPNGRVLLVVPNANSAHRVLGKQMGMLREVTDLNDGDRMLGHHRVYTMDLLREHIASAGLQVSQLAGVTFKALSNRQMAALPRDYVDACCTTRELGEHSCQIAAVLQR
jgi:2-polyprenyl-3-methyl-5-hydroxy-6-metoxy-1,4-benzoquinol methylase